RRHHRGRHRAPSGVRVARPERPRGTEPVAPAGRGDERRDRGGRTPPRPRVRGRRRRAGGHERRRPRIRRAGGGAGDRRARDLHPPAARRAPGSGGARRRPADRPPAGRARTMTPTFVLATHSGNKVREIREILGGPAARAVVSLAELGVEPDPAEDAVEAFETFRENAIAKARFFVRRTGRPTIAEDSGIVVPV